MSWSLGCLRVSKIDSKMRPAVPMIAKMMARMSSTFSPTEVLGTKRPLWRR